MGVSDIAAVERQLARVLASPLFTRARRSSQLLRFLVSSALEGQQPGQPELKEYTLATKVFDRPESFDPRLDSVVRVEATRLRNRLQSYYETATSEDKIEISLPIGSYTPLFVARDLEASVVVPPRSPTLLKRRGWWIAAVVSVLLATALVIAGRRASHSQQALSDLRHLSIAGEVLLSPVLAPDSRHLFYASTRSGGRLRIWRQTLEATDASPLTPSDRDSFDIDLSPDGATVVYWSDRDGGGVYLQPSTGGGETLVAPLGRSPRFSSDGKRVLFWVEEPHTGFGKAYYRTLPIRDDKPSPDGGHHPIATEFRDAHNPQWTPDGRILLCGTIHSNVKAMEHDLWVVSMNNNESPVKTGILDHLKMRQIDVHARAFTATSFQFAGQNLIFSGSHQDQTRLYSLRLDQKTWQPKGDPVPLFEGGSLQDHPSVRQSRIAFTSADSHLNVWRIPLGPDGLASGEPHRITDGPATAVFPGISLDGRVLAYLSLTASSAVVWRKDLSTGIEARIFQSQGINRGKLAPDGSQYFFRMTEGPPPQRQAIYAVNVADGKVKRVCEDCGGPTSVSTHADYVIHETGSRVPGLAVVHLPSRERREIINHSHHAATAGRISPDEKWIAFQLDRGSDGGQLFVAPFRGLVAAPKEEWISVSDPNVSSMEPAWSPDGSALYFLSARLGSRDLWMQRLGPDKRVRGGPIVVRRFQDPHLTPLTFHTRHPRYVGLTAAPGQMVLTLCELRSSVWLGRLAERKP